MPGTRRFKARVAAGCVEIILDGKGRTKVDAPLPYDKILSLAQIDLFGFLQVRGGQGKAGLSLSSAVGPIDLGFITIRQSANDQASWMQMRLGIAALRAIANYEGVPPIETSLTALGEVTGPLVILDALTGDRRMKLDFVPFDRNDDNVTLHLAYGSVLLEGQPIGVVSSQPVLRDDYVGDRREIHLGASLILHAVHGGDGATLREAYLDALDRLSTDHAVLATGDMMRLLDISDEQRLLVVDQPRSLADKAASRSCR